MPPRHVSRLRPLVAAIGFTTCALAGAGGDNATSRPALIDPAIHATPRSDTPHDSFATAEIGETRSSTG